jgi:hypothetical protein
MIVDGTVVERAPNIRLNPLMLQHDRTFQPIITRADGNPPHRSSSRGDKTKDLLSIEIGALCLVSEQGVLRPPSAV